MTFPLDQIVDVIVNISPVSAPRGSFSLGMILGSSTHISPATRVKVYNSLAEMTADGFLPTEEEYEAASLYFAQNPPPRQVAIGRWDKTGPETISQALDECRKANAEWYAVYICDIVKANIVAAATFIETANPPSALFYTTADADVKAGTAGNVFLTLQAAARKRSIGQYSTVEHAGAAIMGYAMGANTGTANSAYTLAYKKEYGVAVESLSQTELTNILNANGNAYINQGSYYDVFRQGKMASGDHFDEVIGLDALSNAIQLAVMDLLVSVPKVPQTEDGVSLILNKIASACQPFRNSGFLAAGTWTGPVVLNLQTGDTLEQGFIIQAESIRSQSQADRDARIAPPIYVCVKLGGAIEFATIVVNVNR